MSELIPKELLKNIPKLYETENILDTVAYIKVFLENWTWGL